MAVGAASYNTPVSGYQPYQQTQQTQRTGRDTDGDDATESAATKAKEANVGATGLPVDANRGRNLNIVA